MIAGPLVGGFITDNLSWRWAFYVNLPLGGVALFFLVTRLHLPKYRTEHRIDWFGAVLLAVGITALVLITTWGGNEYAWTLPADHRPRPCSASLTLAAFVLVERRVAEPILPLHLFRNRNFSLVSGIGFLLGFAMFGAINFLPLYQQTVQGVLGHQQRPAAAADDARLMVVSIVAGQVITRTGRYKIFPIVGGVGHDRRHDPAVPARRGHQQARSSRCLHGGARRRHGLPHADHDAHRPEQRGAEGPRAWPARTATFFRSIGGSFGVALFGAIFVRPLKDDIAARLGPRPRRTDDQRRRRRSTRPSSAAAAADQGRRCSHGIAYGAVGRVHVGDPVRGRGRRCWPCSSRRSRCAATTTTTSEPTAERRPGPAME